MKFAFFHIPASDPAGAADELNRFLARHRIRHVAREFVNQGDASAWCLCVQYDEIGTAPPSTSRTARVDYREILTPEQFDVFSPLRRRRNELAEAAGVPAYTVFSNEQLATMVRREVRTRAELRQIDGIGERRSAAYGDAILEMLRELKTPKADTDNGESDETDKD